MTGHVSGFAAVRSTYKRLIVRLALVLGAASALAACSDHGFLAASGPIAAAQRDHFVSIIGWMMIVILPVFIGLPIVLWRYRANRPRGAYRPDWQNSRLLEVLAWGVPALIVAVLAVGLWTTTTRLDPYAPVPGSENQTPLTVEVIAMDWKFLFVYPDYGIGTADELVIPVGRPVRFRLTSQSVMQSFMIPRLGGQIYAMAGMVTELNLQADEQGTFTGRNTQYNGTGFADQSFKTRAVAPVAFADWVASVRENGETLDPDRFAALARPTTLSAPVEFASVPADLFDGVVASFKGVGPSSSDKTGARS